jgi:hypothetical protein
VGIYWGEEHFFFFFSMVHQTRVIIISGMITSPILTMQQWWQGQLALITSRRGLLLAASPRQSSSPSGEGEKKTDAVTSQQRIVFPSDPLAERSLNLLLVLLHNNRYVHVHVCFVLDLCDAPLRSATSRNPFREIFGMLQDDSIGSDAGAAATRCWLNILCPDHDI